MTPSREQFKDFIASIRKAQEKEDNLGKAFALIWDDDQGQYTPFYISPLWESVYKAFNIMFGLENDEYGENELSWWLEMAPKNEAVYYIDGKGYNVSDINVFYDYLAEQSNEQEQEKEKIWNSTP